jgi:hypothetical protein
LFALLAGTLSGVVSGPAVANAQSGPPAPVASVDPANPVAQVRQAKSWEYGPFVNYGIGLGDRSSYKFLWAGFEAGKVLTPVLHAGLVTGQLEFAGNIMPLWQAYTPAPHLATFTCCDPKQTWVARKAAAPTAAPV